MTDNNDNQEALSLRNNFFLLLSATTAIIINKQNHVQEVLRAGFRRGWGEGDASVTKFSNFSLVIALKHFNESNIYSNISLEPIDILVAQ